MGEIKYTCYRDGTDLTALVEEARGAGVNELETPIMMAVMATTGARAQDVLASTHRGVPVVLELDAQALDDPSVVQRTGEIVKSLQVAQSKRPDAAEPSDWKVGVTCPSQDACRNIFSSATVRPHEGIHRNVTIVGRPPTDVETYLSEAAKELGPSKSLSRASDSAKYVVTNIALVALVAGGFGIFSDAKGGSHDHPVLFGAIVLAAAAALAFAVIGLFPRKEAGVNSNNLVEVAAAYKSAINYRALWAALSTGALILALLLGVAVFLLAGEAAPKSSISTTLDGSGARLLLDTSATAERLPKDAHVTVAVVNSVASGPALATVNATPGEEGSTKSELKVPLSEEVKMVRITSTIGWGNFEKKQQRYEHQRVNQVNLTVAPSTPPTVKK